MRIHRLWSNASFAARPLGAGLVGIGILLAACSSANQGGGGHGSPSGAPAAAAAAAATAAPAKRVIDPRIEAWHAAINKTSPPRNGCFHASYPSTMWKEVPCGTAPNVPVRSHGPRNAPTKVRSTFMRESGSGGTTNTVGNGADWFVKSSGPLAFATGSFPTVTDVTGVDDFSVQLNTNEFPIAASNSLCAGVAAGQCNGWQQAVYSSPTTGPTDPTNGYIQYWLLGYPKGCPSGWNSSNGNCFKNSPMISGVPSASISDLSSIEITMEAGSSDYMRVNVDGEAYAASFGTVMGLDGGGWNLAEYGIFGDYNSNTANLTGNSAGDQAIVAQILTGPPGNTVSCVSSNCDGDGCTSTGEKNNLTAGAQCCLTEAPGGSPTVVFEESSSGQSCSICGGIGQPCCTPNGGTWCAGSSTLCQGGTCEPCGGTGEACCPGELIPCSGSDTCQEGVCGVPSTLSASPANISAAAADGAGYSINHASTQVTASGAWAGGVAPSFTFSGLPEGVTCSANGVAPVDGPSTITCTTSPSTPLSPANEPYAIVVTATIGSYVPKSTTIYLTVTGCQPLTCSDIGYVCGPLDNGCGDTLNCGTCGSGKTCTAGSCYACAERTCPVPEYFNLDTCECQACPCGTLHVDGHYLCAICR